MVGIVEHDQSHITLAIERLLYTASVGPYVAFANQNLLTRQADDTFHVRLIRVGRVQKDNHSESFRGLVVVGLLEDE